MLWSSCIWNVMTAFLWHFVRRSENYDNNDYSEMIKFMINFNLSEPCIILKIKFKLIYRFHSEKWTRKKKKKKFFLSQNNRILKIQWLPGLAYGDARTSTSSWIKKYKIDGYISRFFFIFIPQTNARFITRHHLNVKGLHLSRIGMFLSIGQHQCLARVVQHNVC